MKFRIGTVLLLLAAVIAAVVVVQRPGFESDIDPRGATDRLVPIPPDFIAPDEFLPRIAEFLALAATDPAAALAAAMAEPDAMLASLLVAAIGRSLVDADPIAALQIAAGLEDEMLGQFLASLVIGLVAEQGTDALVALLESADLGAVPPSSSIRDLARSQPDLMLALLERFSPDARLSILNTVLLALAETDPYRALEMLQATPEPGIDYPVWLALAETDPYRVLEVFHTMLEHGDTYSLESQLIPRGIASQYPDAAAAWLESFPDVPDYAYSGALRGIAESDLDRALDLLVAEFERGGSMRSMSASSLINLLDDNQGAVMDRFAALELDDSQRSNLLSNSVSAWARSDYAAAIDWVAANAEILEGSTWSNIAYSIAAEDPSLAEAYVNHLPAGHRGEWAAGIAAGLASDDLDAAAAFAEGLRGQPGYGEALNAVLRALARDDPEFAARRLIEEGESLSTPRTAGAVASEWAGWDAIGAANWAGSLQNEAHRAEAVGSVAAVWASESPGPAQSWVLGLPSGPMRDAGLASVLKAGAANGSIDTRMLDAFSSDRAREGGMANAILQLGLSNPDEARRLLEQHVADPGLRRMAENMLERSAGDSARSIAPTIIY